MYQKIFSRTIRELGAVCLMVLQVLLPCAAVAQAVPRADPKAESTALAGYVNSVSGSVFIRRGSGPEVPAKQGDLFDKGTIFTTGSDGQIGLLFADGQNVSLSPDSVLRVEEYRFDPRDMKTSKATFGLMVGMMRFVTGAIHSQNREALIVSAGDAQIGILSKDVTAFVVQVDSKSQDIGAAVVTVGEISIQTKVGPVTRLIGDQYSRWQSGGAPTPSQPLLAAPAFLQAAAAAARATVLPTSVLLDIEAAAVKLALANLPATGAGPVQALTQAQGALIAAAVIVPTVTPGGGRGCVGSPC